MRRIQLCSRSTESSYFNHKTLNPSRVNVVTPEILVGQIWLQDDEPPSVEIVELHSSDDPHISPDDNDDSLNHTWCYVSDNRSQEIEDCYRINKKARERRRSIVKNTRPSTNSPNIEEFRDGKNYEVSEQYSDENITLNHQMNYFTIINKHFIDTDTSTDEDNGDVEIVTSDDIVREATDGWNADNRPYDANLDKETRTIWIYSFKNKRLLSGNDFETTNIPGFDSSSCSTSCYIESDEEYATDNSTNTPIIAPTPSQYIPRLNLTVDPALSTVTEVTEPNKQASSDERKDVVINKFQKPKNSWVRNDANSGSGRKGQRFEKSTNIVNWMALSPREKRRRSNALSDKWKGSILYLSEDESEGRLKIKEQKNNESVVIEPVEVKVDVHVSASEQNPNICMVNTLRSADIATKTITDNTIVIEKAKDSDDKENIKQDRGDHEIKCQQKPQIVLSRKCMINTATITDPIEKLNSSNWIYEEKFEKQTATFDYTLDNLENLEADKQIDEHAEIDNIWVKNAKALMKPVQWAEYLPITETPLSLHLSLSSIIGEKRHSWFKRLSKCIICCK